ncbi:MAG: polysaccharide deacetylase family protein [Gammaproteobacteria bacterium]|nr:polysaccharide deacetylase family protein [Gammaproteobacteria bacterium]
MFILNILSDKILGECIREIKSSQKSIYLTFDDGPNQFCTPQVLDLLKKYNIHASFFLIAENILPNIEIFNRIKNEGHAIGNHSLDHNTLTYFKGEIALEHWIDCGEKIIASYLGHPSIGFRPPAGVRTPPLKKIMNKINSKPIMWKHRFYDTYIIFTDSAWKKKTQKIKDGDIVLLHDTHKTPEKFLASLENLIKYLIKNKYQIIKLPSTKKLT